MKTEMHRNAQELDGMRNRSREASQGVAGNAGKRRRTVLQRGKRGPGLQLGKKDVQCTCFE